MCTRHSFHKCCRQWALPTLIVLCSASSGVSQVAWPDLTVQDVNWASGIHDIHVPQKIISPLSPSHPASISGTADVEFVSATAIELKEGFQAAGFTGGHFIARIDEALEDPNDVVIIAPDPASNLHHGKMHVPKWEKLEIGIRLPQLYQEVIDSFFVHFYPNAPLDLTADPGNTDPVHDLNPYADDSLQLVMTLTSPTGVQSMKWGFFMRESMWASGESIALLVEDTASTLSPYNIRFRCAPDEVGTWQFAISIRAPNTLAADDTGLPPVLYSGYSFSCGAPLADNHGPLHVNTENHRTLQFEDSTAFFGMGTNMADMSHWQWHGLPPGVWWSTFYKRDFDVMQKSMDQLHDAGGNYMRMFLLRHIFAPEWANLGVYDAFKVGPTCQQSFPAACDDALLTDGFVGNCQFQCQSFDRMLDKARDNGIYIQLCIDPYTTGFGYETFLWGPHPYVRNFVEPSSATRPYNVREFFFAGGNTANTDTGVFYYWKRKYKYIMSRWGYAVNIAAIEPFNEIDQTLGYREHNLSDTVYCDVCPENWVLWPQDNGLRPVINTWLTDIADYVRNPVDTTDPVHSPLGESDKLFLVSYADGDTSDQSYFLPFTNPKVDLLDVHKYVGGDSSRAGQPDEAMEEVYDHAQAFRSHYPSTDPAVTRKPFNHGESNYFTDRTFGGQKLNLEKFFHNYDVSFHNELWSSAFSGNFATSLSWHWERIFWWPDALPPPPADANNQFPLNPNNQFSNVLGAVNRLDLGIAPAHTEYDVVNRTIYHNFKPLADLLSDQNLQYYDLFNWDYTPYKVHDEGNELECYYLVGSAGVSAIGWVHNLNAWEMNSYYMASGIDNQNFLGCAAPNAQSISLPGFAQDHDLHITWYSTRMNGTTPPPADTTSNLAGEVTLDLSADPLHGVANNYLDTLHSDYAFIITPGPLLRVEAIPEVVDTLVPSWDFALYPNPADDRLNVLLPSDAPTDLSIYDLSGRRVDSWGSVIGPLVRLSINKLSRGIYSVRASDGTHTKVKELIIR